MNLRIGIGALNLGDLDVIHAVEGSSSEVECQGGSVSSVCADVYVHCVGKTEFFSFLGGKCIFLLTGT